MDGVRAYSETGRGAWKGGVSSLEPDGRCIPGTHGRVVCFMQNQRDELIVIGGGGKIAGCLAANVGAKQQNYLCIELNGGQDARE